MGFFGDLIGKVAGPLVGGLIGSSSQKSTNKTNVQLAREANQLTRESVQKQIDFQTLMSNTAYQRAMDDMYEAGLNPILAAKYGGASTPGGAHMQAQMPQITDPMMPAMSTALDIYKGQSTVKTQEASIEKISQEIENLKETEHLTQIQKAKVSVEINRIQEEVHKVRNESQGLHYDNIQKEILAEFYDSAELARIAKDIGITPGTFKAIFEAFFNRK